MLLELFSEKFFFETKQYLFCSLIVELMTAVEIELIIYS
jgi:hypothetical protein